MKEQKGGDPKRISEILKQAIKELNPKIKEPKFFNVEYSIPSIIPGSFKIGLN